MANNLRHTVPMKPVTQPLSHRPPSNSWRFHRSERIGLALGLVVVLAFGAQHERRTALRSRPMTDLGVFACAAWAVRSGDNPYTVSDWNGWHYHYPPLTAILMAPLAHPLPDPAPTLPRDNLLVMNLCGRGDKDIFAVAKHLGMNI